MTGRSNGSRPLHRRDRDAGRDRRAGRRPRGERRDRRADDRRRDPSRGVQGIPLEQAAGTLTISDPGIRIVAADARLDGARVVAAARVPAAPRSRWSVCPRGAPPGGGPDRLRPAVDLRDRGFRRAALPGTVDLGLGARPRLPRPRLGRRGLRPERARGRPGRRRGRRDLRRDRGRRRRRDRPRPALPHHRRRPARGRGHAGTSTCTFRSRPRPGATPPSSRSPGRVRRPGSAAR